MKDMRNKEVQVGDVVVFNRPDYRVLDMSQVIAIRNNGVVVSFNDIDENTCLTVIPEKQFVIIGDDKENVYGT